jgi:hypothetical protein
MGLLAVTRLLLKLVKSRLGVGCLKDRISNPETAICGAAGKIRPPPRDRIAPVMRVGPESRPDLAGVQLQPHGQLLTVSQL